MTNNYRFLKSILVALSLVLITMVNAQTTETFNYTGTAQTWTVPSGVTSINIEAWGAQGANALDRLQTNATGGSGGSASGNLAVSPGQLLYIYVGGQGSTSGAGGFNGGGAGGNSSAGGDCFGGPAGGGGGASDIRVGADGLINRVLVAGGGGGAGRDYCNGTCQPCGCGGGGGGAGGLIGTNGSSGNDCGYGYAGSSTNGGGGATAITGGLAGPGDAGGPSGFSGIAGIGGNGADGSYDVAGGGGGGGYFGGGGGGGANSGSGVAGGGGGGGSSYIGGVVDGSTIPGVRSGHGLIVITYDDPCTAPTISCPEPITVNTDEGVCGASVQFAATGGGTPTPTLTYTLDGTEISSPHFFDVGTYTVVVTAENDCGNLSCTFTVTVNDNEPPVVNTQNITVYLDEYGMASITPVQVDNGSTDNCGAITMTLDITEFDCSNVGINTVTLTVKDYAYHNTGNVLSGILGHWTFEPGQEYDDLTSNWGQMNLFGNATVANGYLQVNGFNDFVRIDSYIGPTIVAKTLLSWVSLTDLAVMSGSALTIDRVNTDHFDGLVYGERQPYRWMSGSSSFTRTQDFVPGYAETTPNQLLMIAITYESKAGGQVLITGYRNGVVIGSYTSGNIGSWSAGNAEIWMGKRHGGSTIGPGQLSAKIYESQLYGRALSAEEIQLLYNDGISVTNKATGFAEVTVADNIAPHIVDLPEDIGQNNDLEDCGAIVYWTEPTSADNCNGHSIQRIQGNASGAFFAVGTHTITYKATDASGNKVSESFTITITDYEEPVVETKDISIQLGLSGNATITPADVDDGSTDNCEIEEMELDITAFTVADKGNNTLTLTVKDIHGNEASNTANVFVANLPAPWKECDTHVSANGTGDYDFDPTNPTFNLTATGKSTTLMDVHHFLYQEMCGNQVTVIARLAELENGGWAGVMMRESCSPGAKAILFKTRLYNPNVIIGYRTIDNKAMRNLSQVAQLIRWMKIQRNGSNFKVFTSYNGTTWQQRYSGTINMDGCIQAGIFTESVLATRTSMAWFDHVKVEYGLKSGDEIVIDDNNMQSEKPEIELYPNPADDLVTISIPENESEVSYSITDMDGRVIEQSGFIGCEAVLDVSSFKPGLYVIRMEIGGEVVTKRLVVM